MSEPPKLGLADLRAIVSDPAELAKGAQAFDQGALSNLARLGPKLFADAKGSGVAPYKVQILFEAKGPRGRCSCMAARSRPFCKHAAALLVAWARAPGSFAVAAAPPPGAEPPKKTEVKKGKVDAQAVMARGVEQVSTVVRELAVAGVAALAADRAEQVRALGAALRDSRLRRLSAKTIELAGHLEHAAARQALFDPAAYAELLGDLLLTARKLEKHLAGEPLKPEHVEELIGKTWTKKDRVPVAGLDLVEYAFLTRTTADDFVIRESRFVDLASGTHYSEKQILPAFLAKRAPPKPSHAGRVLAGAAGSLYPGYSPRRLDLADPGARRELGGAELTRLVERAEPSASAVLALLAERRKDLFAPEALPVALRADTVLADGPRLQVVDEHHAALYLPGDRELLDALDRALSSGRLVALLGDVALEGALPTLFPLAVLLDRGGALALEGLSALDAAALLESRKVRAAQAANQRGRAHRWVEVARQAGASGAAVLLGEVREELAEALAAGLGSVVPRRTDPLVSRLSELSFGKQAELLADLSRRDDPAEKLDDLVKLHQVLGLALSRLAAAAAVDPAALEAVPTHPSVRVKASAQVLAPAQAAAEAGAGRLNRFEAARHYARHYAALPAEALAQSVYPTWADGAASPFVVLGLARAPAAALAAAERVLAGSTSAARVAKLTAIRVLGALGGPEAARVLDTFARATKDRPLAAHARRAAGALGGHVASEEERARVEDLFHDVLNAGQKEQRIAALVRLADEAQVDAIPLVRASAQGDVAADVRRAAVFTLARLGDLHALEGLVEKLAARSEDAEGAKVAARALGVLGDLRGLPALLAAWAEGWQPVVVAESIAELGLPALPPLLDLLEAQPALAQKKGALAVLKQLPGEEVAAEMIRRLEALGEAGEFVPRASLYLAAAADNVEARRRVADRVLALRPGLKGPRAALSAEEKALLKRCARA